MKLLLIFVCFIVVACAYPSEKTSEKEKSSKQIKVSNHVKEEKKEENLKGAESIYHSLPMPFVHYPFPFVNSYTPRYFPYGYAGVDHGYGSGFGYAGGIGYGAGGVGYGFGFGHYV